LDLVARIRLLKQLDWGHFVGSSPLFRLRILSRNGAFQRSLRILTKRDHFRLGIISVLQVGTSLLDLIGVAVVGLLATLAVRGVQSKSADGPLGSILDFLQIGSSTLQVQAAILGLIACTLLIAKTIISMLFTRRILKFLSRRAAGISSDVTGKLFSQPITKVREMSSQETVYALGYGVSSIMLGVIGTSVSLVADVSLLVIMSVGLFFIDPEVAIGTILYFSVVLWILYKFMSLRAVDLGKQNWDLSVDADKSVVETLSTYKELYPRNSRAFFVRQISETRLKLADVTAEIQFQPNISKYVLETSVVLGAIGLAATQFVLKDAALASATLAMFLTAGARIAPAILRVQQGGLMIRNSLGTSQLTLNLIESLRDTHGLPEYIEPKNFAHVGFVGHVEISELELKFNEDEDPILSNVNLQIEANKMYAIVGPSGAGKTSLIDTFLGIVEPTRGRIEISSHTPIEAYRKWPGAISYVPQEIAIINDSLRNNILLGFNSNLVGTDTFDAVLEASGLRGVVDNLASGLDTLLGNSGIQLSGGERQRLGIARALITNPKLLILDEATSSLDAQGEASISEALKKIKGSITVVLIAHRLSTVREADSVVYLNKGKIVATGTFEQVRNTVSDFDVQAQLMGL
jgi:ABC-type multidrug transport system fused ATPase/permease subunit